VDPLTLATPGGRVRVDRATGAVVGIRVDEPDLELVGEPGRRGLLRLAAPIPEVKGHFLETGVHGAPTVERLGDGMRLRYANLPTPHRTLPIDVEIDLAPEEDGLAIRARVRNGWDQPIPQVIFPQLFGLAPIGGVEETRVQLGRGRMHPLKELAMRPDDTTFFEPSLYRYYSYGLGPFNMKWLDYGSARGGLTIFSRDPRYHVLGLLVDRPDRAKDRVDLRWIHYPYVAPGETWESGDYVLTTHPGDWYAGARAYKKFADQRYPYNAPKRIREALGFRSIWMTYLTSPPMYRFADLPAIAEEMGSLDLAELCVWSWFVQGGYPFDHDPRQGTREELADAIRRCQTIGVPVSLFVSHHLLVDGPQTDPSWEQRNAAGQRMLSNWTFSREFLPRFRPLFDGSHSYTMASGMSPGWQETGLAEYRRMLELGAASACFDVFFIWGGLDFNPARAGRPGEEGNHLIAFAQKVRDMIHAHHPDGTFSGEGVTDTTVPVLDYTWEWTSSFHFANAGPFRYVFPRFRLNANVNEHPRSSLLAFVEDGFLNVMPGAMERRLSDYPEMVALLKKLGALRRRFLRYSTEGQFHFMEGLTIKGLTIEGLGASGCVARLYTHGGDILVLATNPSDGEIDATLEIDPAALDQPDRPRGLRAFDLDGNQIDERAPAGGRIAYPVHLKPDELRILEVLPSP
jgi:hypothetical protein